MFPAPIDTTARIVVYDLATDLETELTTGDSQQPKVWHDLVVWQDARSGTSWDIYLHQLSTGMELPVVTSADWEIQPDLRGGKLVYSNVTAALTAQRLHIFDLGTWTDSVQSPGTATRQFAPAADWFVFGWCQAVSDSDLFAADYTAPGTTDTLSVSTGEQILGGADGRIFAWSDNRAGNWDVRVSAYGGAELVVTSGPSFQGDPAISSGTIVFEDDRLGDFDIYVAQLTGVPATGAGWLKIDEVLADPGAADDVGGDGTVSAAADEFVEIVNATDVTMDLSGCTLSDATGVRHVFPPGTLVAPVGAIVVFGGGTPAALVGGARRQVASSGALGLDDAGDTLTLRNPTGGAIDTMTYGTEGGMDDALVREPEIGGAFVRHSTVTPGVRFSPGLASDGYAW